MTSYKFAVFKYDANSYNRYSFNRNTRYFINRTLNNYVCCDYDIFTNTRITDLNPVDNFPYEYLSCNTPVNRYKTVYRYFRLDTDLEKDLKNDLETYIVIHRGDLEETWICCTNVDDQSNITAFWVDLTSSKMIRTETVNIIEPKKYKLTINNKSYEGSKFKLKTSTMNSNIDLNQGNKLKLTYKSGKTKIIDYETNLE